MKLRDRVAIITGAGRGIGEAVALAFAREGAKLVIASRTGTELARVAGEIRDQSGPVQAVPTDVTSEEQVMRLVRNALDAYSQVDILVNAAGILGPVGPLWTLELREWAEAVRVNLFGTLICCKAVLPHMIARGHGKIINFSGGGATAPLSRFSAYAASKAAVVRLTETLAEEVKEFNIEVNAVAPGLVDTRIQDAVLTAGDRAGAQAERIRRLRETGEGGVPPELAAELVVYLASEESDGLTGKLIAAPYDGWQSWDAARVKELMSAPWLTLRRIDAFTLKPLVAELAEDGR